MLGGWDQGRVFTSNSRDENSELVEHRAQVSEDFQLQDARRTFRNFIREFNEEGVPVYREQLVQHHALHQPYLKVDMSHLTAFDQELAHSVTQQPAQYLAVFEKEAQLLCRELLASTVGLEEPQQKGRNKYQVQFIGCSNPIPIRLLNSQSIGKLVTVPGIVISASKIHAKPTLFHLECRVCKHTQEVEANVGFQSTPLPKQCGKNQGSGAAGSEKCGQGTYFINGDKCNYVDQQTLKLQESPGTIPTGEMPRHLVLSVDRGLAGMAVPGTRVTVTGIYQIYKTSGKNKRKAGTTGAVAIRNPFLDVVGLSVHVEGAGRSNATFTKEEEEKFIEISRRRDLYEDLSQSIAPAIYGYSDIKKAIACQLFGGSRKLLPDGVRLRGDINILLLGDPGTAKSQFLKFVEKVAPIGVYTSGKGSSAAGLTASVIRDPSSREFYLEGGAMVLADGGVVCIDEFDKMHLHDRVAIHEAMEQQTISIAKAGITTILNSRTSVLAAANPVFGSYSDSHAEFENIEFQSTILSRFDMIFLVRDARNEDTDRHIANHVIGVHMNARSERATGRIDTFDLKRYIGYCRAKCAPRLSPRACELLGNHYVRIRSRMKDQDKDQGRRAAIPITVRQLEAITRISEGLAKMMLKSEADERDVNEAIRLFKVSTEKAALQGISTSETLPPELLSEVRGVEVILKRRLPIGSRTSVKRIVDDLTAMGQPEYAVRRAINIMAQKQELQYQNQRKVVSRLR